MQRSGDPESCRKLKLLDASLFDRDRGSPANVTAASCLGTSGFEPQRQSHPPATAVLRHDTHEPGMAPPDYPIKCLQVRGGNPKRSSTKYTVCPTRVGLQLVACAGPVPDRWWVFRVDDELRRIFMFTRQQHEEIACCGIPDNPSPAGVVSYLDSRIVLQLKAVARQFC